MPFHAPSSHVCPLRPFCRHCCHFKQTENQEPKNFIRRTEEFCFLIQRLQMEQKEKADGEVEENGEESEESERKGKGEHPLPLMALNHVSRLCRNVKDSIDFYTKALGFVKIERPPSFDFDGAWLFNYGVGIHLVQSEDGDRLPEDTDHLDPMDNHISFQCEDMEAMEQKLKDLGVKYKKRTLDDENGESIDQLFFNDPDGFMIEICNCENLKLIPAGSFGKIKLPADRRTPPVDLNDGLENK